MGSMKYISVSELAEIWGISERTVRNYCAKGRIQNAFLAGKNWNIPADAERASLMHKRTRETVLTRLQEENAIHLSGGIYHKIRIDLTLNLRLSNDSESDSIYI